MSPRGGSTTRRAGADRTRLRFLAAVRTAWQSQPELAGVRRVVVAVSGGADSVALLLALHGLATDLGLALLVAAHLDHGLRGADGQADRRWVAALARRLGLRYRTGHADVRRLAARRGLSIEAAARDARHAFLRRVAHATAAEVVVLGHTRDDQAETLLLRLARGAGMTGLGGMAPVARVSGLLLVRPLLDIERGAARAFLEASGTSWREDASNRSPAFRRNRVRLEILPLIARRLNPSVVHTLARTAAVLREEDAWLDAEARRGLAACGGAGGDPDALDAHRLRRLPAALRRRAWRHWFRDGGVPGDRIDGAAVARAESLLLRPDGSAWVPLGGGFRVVRRYTAVRLERTPALIADTPAAPITLHVPGVTDLPGFGCRARTAWAGGRPVERSGRPGTWPAGCALRRCRAEAERLAIRAWQPGDRIAPQGMTGSRKLQDVLAEARVPRDARTRFPILVRGREIVWVPGYRVARGWEPRHPGEPCLHLYLDAAQSTHQD